jgi:hypothetical protein
MMKRAELQSNILGKTFDVTPPRSDVKKERFTQFQDVIGEGMTGSTIQTSQSKRWTLVGDEKIGDKYNANRQYKLPAIKDPDAASRNREEVTVNYYKTKNGKVVLNAKGMPMINYPGINAALGLTSSE